MSALTRLIAALKAETYLEDQGSPIEQAYRKGHNDRTRSLVRRLEAIEDQLQLNVALVELRDSRPIVAHPFRPLLTGTHPFRKRMDWDDSEETQPEGE